MSMSLGWRCAAFAAGGENTALVCLVKYEFRRDIISLKPCL
jgi:hypothetical protein